MRTELWLSQLQRKSARGPAVMAEYRDSLFEVRLGCKVRDAAAAMYGANVPVRLACQAMACWPAPRHATFWQRLLQLCICTALQCHATAVAATTWLPMRAPCTLPTTPPSPWQKLAPEVLGEIEKDVHRTFPNHPRLSTEEGQRAMLNVLRAYALADPEIGYTQVWGPGWLLLGPCRYGGWHAKAW